MAEEIEAAEKPPGKRSRLPMILGLVLGLVGGGGGFFAVSSGMFAGGDVSHTDTTDEAPAYDATPANEVAFVALDQIVVSLGPNSPSRHLRFEAQLEVDPTKVADVEKLKPRITDVLNTYLRALKPSDLEDQGKFILMRAHMLRRVQIVTGPGLVHDLLVMEMVLS